MVVTALQSRHGKCCNQDAAIKANVHTNFGVILQLQRRRKQKMADSPKHGPYKNLVPFAAECSTMNRKRVESRLCLLPSDHLWRFHTLKPHLAIPCAGEEVVGVCWVECNCHDAVIVPARMGSHFRHTKLKFFGLGKGEKGRGGVYIVGHAQAYLVVSHARDQISCTAGVKHAWGFINQTPFVSVR
jgi:hypothetical protein